MLLKSYNDLDLKSLARDLDLSDLQYLLAKDFSSNEDEDLDLEIPFPTITPVEVEETVIDLSHEQVRKVVDFWNHGPSAEIDIEKLRQSSASIDQIKNLH